MPVKKCLLYPANETYYVNDNSCTWASDRDFDATHVQICQGLITHHMIREVNVQTVIFSREL